MDPQAEGLRDPQKTYIRTSTNSQYILVDSSGRFLFHSDPYPHARLLARSKLIPFIRITKTSFSRLQDLQFLLHNVSFLTAPGGCC